MFVNLSRAVFITGRNISTAIIQKAILNFSSCAGDMTHQLLPNLAGYRGPISHFANLCAPVRQINAHEIYRLPVSLVSMKLLNICCNTNEYVIYKENWNNAIFMKFSEATGTKTVGWTQMS